MSGRGQLTVRIAGGLGNQLFQYASARSLALRSGVPLVIDHLSGFPRDFYKRRYLLSHFQVQAELIAPRAAYLTNWDRFRRRLQIRRDRTRPLEAKRYLLETDNAFDPRLLDWKITRPVYMEGAWQHEEYFEGIRDLLREELAQQTQHDAPNLAMAERIRSLPGAIALHVRRLHGVPATKDAKPLAIEAPWQQIDPSYFPRAIDFVARQVEDPHFFVFADYPDWARENVRSAYPMEFVAHNGPDQDYEDFWLMQQCRHFIIANSTFSWWAAWLARNDRKIVTAPKDAIGRMLQSVPPSWLLL